MFQTRPLSLVLPTEERRPRGLREMHLLPEHVPDLPRPRTGKLLTNRKTKPEAQPTRKRGKEPHMPGEKQKTQPQEHPAVTEMRELLNKNDLKIMLREVYPTTICAEIRHTELKKPGPPAFSGAPRAGESPGRTPSGTWHRTSAGEGWCTWPTTIISEER